jgi:hypothetical protein
MAMEPITLFARIAEPARVARRLRELVPSAQIDGSDDGWRKAVAVFGERKLTFTYDPAYCSEPSWSQQMNGMRGYFSRFPRTDRQSKVLLLTTSFRISIGTLFDPDFEPDGDPRLDLVYEIAESLDGVLFTPSSLRDARGRILISTGGEEDEDPDAVWPKVLGEVPLSDPRGAAMHEESRPNPVEADDDAVFAPEPDRVARRALALTALTTRAILEQEVGTPEADETYRDLLAWIDEIGIGDEFEPDEWAVLQRPTGQLSKLDPRGHLNSTWRLEGLVVLAWALGRFEIPPHDELVEVNPLWQSLGVFDADASRLLLVEPTLRPREEIEALRRRLFALHWRLRNFHLNRKPMDFAEFARSCWFGPLEIAGLPLVDDDLAIGGDRIDRTPRDAFTSAHSAAQERHQAVNWLLRGPDRYSEASVAT